jgi:hypothetical protein
LCLSLTLFPTVAPAAPLSYVPVGHWTYEAVARLVALGLVPSFRLAARPLTRLEMATIVRDARAAAEDVPLSDGDRQTLDLLAAEFAPDLAGLAGRPAAPQTAAGVQARGGAGGMPTLTTHPSSIPGWTAITALSIPLGSALLEAVAGSADPGLQRGYLSVRLGAVDVQVGRDAQWWGPAARGALLLSDTAGPVDAVRVAFDVSPTLRFLKLVAPLDEPGRYLVGTRVDWQAGERVRFGVSEAAVAFAGPLFWYHLANPLPGVLTAALRPWDWQTAAGVNDNFLGSLDFEMVPAPGTLVYGELMIDDVHRPFPPIVPPGGPYPAVDPSRWGFTSGLYLTNPFRDGRTGLRLEYTRVYNWTYTHHSLNRSYTYRGLSLGHWLGSDGDDLAVTVDRPLGGGDHLRLWLARTRHGEGRLGTIWSSQTEAWQNYFLAGIVETRHSLGAAWERRAPGLTYALSLEVSYVVNRGNVAGDDGWDLFVGVRFASGW